MSRLEVDLFDPAPDPDLLCAICQCVLSNPTEASTCRHVFCHKCITTWLNSGARTCPTCRAVMTSYDLRRALPALCNVIGRLVMRCVNHAAGCSTRLPVERLETHLRTDCQWVLERCECGTELLRRDLEAHKDVCVYCVFPCTKCDLMITTRERNTHNCFLALKQAISGQKYLLKELRRHLEQGTSVSQQLQSQLATFDRQTRNYCPSLTTELTPSAQNSTAVSTHVASSYPPDILVVLDDHPFSPSRTANNGNQHVPVSEARQSEENAHVAGTSFQVLSPSEYSEDESQASESLSAGDNRTPRRLSDIFEEDEFDAADERDERNIDDEIDEYSNNDSYTDDHFQSRDYQEYFDSDGPEETYTDNESDSHNSRPASMPRRALQDSEEDDNYNDDDDDDDDNDAGVLQQTAGGSQIAQDARDERAGDNADRPAYTGSEHDTARSSGEGRISVRLRLNVSAGDRWSGDAASGAVQTSRAGDADVGDDAVAGNHDQDVSRGFSDDNDDASGDEYDAASHHDSSDSYDSSSPISDHSYRQTRRRYRSLSSITSTSSPASPSLHGDDDADEDEVYLPVLSPSNVQDVDNDADAGRQNSGDNREASSERQSRSDAGHEQNRRPASHASSAASSRSSVRGESSQRASSRSSSDHSWLSSDTSADSDDSTVPPHRRGTKRLRSVSSDTDSDSRDTDADHHRHKLHRLR